MQQICKTNCEAASFIIYYKENDIGENGGESSENSENNARAFGYNAEYACIWRSVIYLLGKKRIMCVTEAG